ncbi:MAG: hypothetical protein SNJ68_06435, partial [Cyanobacteriota bacterium]
QESPLIQVIHLLEQAFGQLKVKVPPLEIERMAVLIFTRMERGSRRFHTTHHSLTVSSTHSPIQILAGLFHDIVYLQLDQQAPDAGPYGVPKALFPKLEGVITPTSNGIHVASGQPSLPLYICLHLFNFQPDQHYSHAEGINEFLSACMALDVLEPWLSIQEQVAIVASIEATIPFRPVNGEGYSCLEQLEQRIGQLNQELQLGLSSQHIEQILRDAVELTNRDVENFAFTDAGFFLDHTWALLPEMNPRLLEFNLYSVVEYRRVLQRMEQFFLNLDPQRVFQRHRGYPSRETWQAMTEQATQNIRIGQEYIGVKLLAIGLLEAVALSSGGDGPISLFLGYRTPGQDCDEPLSSQNPWPIHLEVGRISTNHNPVVWELLYKGRSSTTRHDLTRSPLAAFIYSCLGQEVTQTWHKVVHQMFANQLEPENVLRQFQASHAPVLETILYTCAQFAPTRRASLIAYLDP